MSESSTSSTNNKKPRRLQSRPRSWLWLSLTGIVIVAAISAAVVFPRLNGAPTASAQEDALGALNLADVVITDLRQEEEFSGKLESIKGTGTIIPAAQIVLAFDTSGTVADVLVQVGQNVQAGDVLARLNTTNLARAVTQAEIALRRVGTGHRLDLQSSKLSGGEMQRVATARAFAGNPSIVLADEPTGNLDSQNSDAIVELIQELNAGGATIVVITHNLEIASSFPRVIGLLDGQIEYDTAAEEVL